MNARRLRIGELAMTGVEDLVAAVRAAPGLFAFLLLATMVATYVEDAAPAALGLPDTARSVVILGVSSLLGAAIAVVMHRFVILAETNTVASLAARGRVVLDFATVLFGAQYFVVLPALLAGSIWGTQEAMPVWIFPVSITIAVTGLLVILRHLLVFPAVAVGADDRSLKGNVAEIRGVILPVVFAYIVAMLLIALIGLLVGAPLLLFGVGDLPHVSGFLRLVTGLAASATAVAIVSRAYLWREGRWPDA